MAGKNAVRPDSDLERTRAAACATTINTSRAKINENKYRTRPSAAQEDKYALALLLLLRTRRTLVPIVFGHFSMILIGDHQPNWLYLVIIPKFGLSQVCF